MPSIKDFYSGQTIFLTGATGFLGKLTIEKLLRTCPDIKKIYILIRPKYNNSLEDRLRAILDNACFTRLKAQFPDFPKKLQVLSGDCSRPFLGLNPDDIEVLKKEVTCVIHGAAVVKFDAPLKEALRTNVRSVRDLLDIAKDMEKLRAFVHVSTAFSHCTRKTIGEEFYEVDADPDKLLAMAEVANDEWLEVLAPKILGEWPNTYVFTKAVAEKLIQNYKQSLPIAVVRPAVVISTAEEPHPGWIDGFQGVVGLISGVSLGLIRSLPLDPAARSYVVPADYVVQTTIAAAWNVENSPNNIPIYNFTGPAKGLTWGELIETFKEFTFVYPLSAAVWYRYIQTSPSMVVHKMRAFVLHTLFAYFVDAILLAMGKGTLAVEKYGKINKLIDLLAYFTRRTWTFRTDNVENLYAQLDEEDKKDFGFVMKGFDWRKYVEKSAMGGRIYLMKDPLETLPKAKRKMVLLAAVHYVFVGLLLYYLLTWVFWPLVRYVYVR